jgi:hypothetical protein
MVGGAKGAFLPPFPRLRKRKPKDPTRSTATIPTSVKRFHWIVPFQIIGLPSKFQFSYAEWF